MIDSAQRAKSLDEAVSKVQALASVATEDQMRAFANLLAQCTIALADGMSELSGIGFTAKAQLVQRLDELGRQLKSHEMAMTNASIEASAQTRTLLTWNKALVIATSVYTLLTLILVLVTILKK